MLRSSRLFRKEFGLTRPSLLFIYPVLLLLWFPLTIWWLSHSLKTTQITAAPNTLTSSITSSAHTSYPGFSLLLTLLGSPTLLIFSPSLCLAPSFMACLSWHDILLRCWGGVLRFFSALFYYNVFNFNVCCVTPYHLSC